MPTASYAKDHGRTTKSGHTYYKGNGHRHWMQRSYLSKWKCVVLMCPCTGGWYYWNEATSAYLPICYLATFAPAEEAPNSEGLPEADEGEGPDEIP